MLTIRKKLEEQASGGERTPVTDSQLSRKPSFRSQLLTKEANELGGAMSSQYDGHCDLVVVVLFPYL